MDPSMPRKFFEQHVRPSYEEWLGDPLDERLAKHAVSDANIMAARVLHYWKDLDRSQVYGLGAEKRDEGRYRDELAKRECADFALVRDVAEAYKHVQLDRASRLVTRYDQTAAKETLWGRGRVG